MVLAATFFRSEDDPAYEAHFNASSDYAAGVPTAVPELGNRVGIANHTIKTGERASIATRALFRHWPAITG